MLLDVSYAKFFTAITFDRSTLAQGRQHQKCKHEKAQLQAMHDDQNFVGLLKKYFLIKYTRLSNNTLWFSNTPAMVQCVLTQVPVYSISRSTLTIFWRLWNWFQRLYYLYKDLNNKICFSESHHLRFKFPILKSCLKIRI